MTILEEINLENDKVKLEVATDHNVEFLVNWTLDPVAQGPYKVVPNMTKEELKELFLNKCGRCYFLIRNQMNEPIGRFYYRRWRFNREDQKIDWELNIFIAKPEGRGKGYGTAAQQLAVNYLLGLPETNSVFAYTMVSNVAEQKSLEKCGLKLKGNLPNDYYQVDIGELMPKDFVLYVLDNKQ